MLKPMRANWIRPISYWRAELLSALQGARDYAWSRQTPDGGFCSYRTAQVEEPSLADTYQATATLRLAGAGPTEFARTLHFLDQYARTAQGLHALYYRTGALLILRGGGGLDDMTRRQISSLPLPELVYENWNDLSVSLRVACLTAELYGWAGDRADYSQDIRKLLYLSEYPQQRFGFTPNIFDMEFFVRLCHACDVRAGGHSLYRFLLEVQHPSYGFAIHSSAQSANLDVICAGINCCVLLGAQLVYPDDIVDFVLGCQLKDGSFARTSGASSTLESTHRALHILALLFKDEVFPSGSGELAINQLFA